MKSLLLVCAVLAALLVLPSGPPPAAAAPVGPAPSDPGLAGRNCGGTSKPSGLAGAGLAQLTGGWALGGPLDAPPTAANQLGPSVAVGPTGQVFYAWQESRGGDTGDIFAAALGAAPTTGRRAVRVDDTGSAVVEQAAPSLAVDGAGTLHVVWEDTRLGGARDLYYASSANGGASWSANSSVSGALASPTHSSPHMLAGPDGALYLTWDGGEEIYYSRRAGGSWSAPDPVNAPRAVDRDRPRLAFDAQGRLFAAWEDYRAGSTAPAVYVARLDQLATNSWGAELRASPAGAIASQPSLAAAPDGTLYLAYQGATGIYLTASSDGGATWGPARRVDDGDGNAFTNPRIAVDERGAVHCIWCRLRVNVVADVLAARSINGGVSWGPQATLASTTGTAEPIDLLAGEGTIHAAWSDDVTGRPTLHTASWSEGRLYLPLLRR